MRILDSTRMFAVIFTLGVIMALPGYADTIYVDNKLSVSSTGTYSISGRNNSGKNGKAFKSIQMALDSMKVGDVICIRGGVYPERGITIPSSKNGTSWTTGKFNTMTSFPGEWAIIDGQKDLFKPTGIGPCLLGNTTSQSLKFWKFERIELRNGATADGQSASGFFGNHGPFHFRYCVFQGNMASYEGNNPGALKGYTWQDCIVEYCYFYDNGAPVNHRNSAHIVIFADYNEEAHARDGFVNNNTHTMGNIYRYNLFVSGSAPAVAIKYKNDTFLTGRNPGAGKGYDDTWKHRGDHIHHNIFRKTRDYAVCPRQDFIQLYNNIFDSCYGAIAVGDWWKGTIYKATVFNNTVLGRGQQGFFFSHYKCFTFQEPNIIQYAYNNILENVGDDYNKCDITLQWDAQITNGVVDSFKIDRNFIYRPATNQYDANGTNVFWLGVTSSASPRHTVSAFTSRFPNSKMYFANADAANPVFKGNSGADRMITRGEYKLSAQQTIANAGKNIRHPFLDGMTIPAYIGATDPQDPNNNRWVNDVLALVNLSNNVLPDTVPENPVPPNNAPVVSLLSAANNAAQISDSVVVVRWKAQDDQGITNCSLFVSVNDSNYRLISVKNSSLDSIIWNIPSTAKSVKFMLRAYDAQGKFGEGVTTRYLISIIREVKKQIRLYAYAIDGSSIFTVWGNYPDAPAFKQVAVVCRADRFAASVSESGSKVYYSSLSRGNAVISGFANGQACYVSVFGELSSGTWTQSCDSVQVITNSMAVLGRSAFSDTIYVPEDGWESLSHALYCFKGNSNVWTKGSATLTNSIVGGKRALAFTVPSSAVCDTSGFYAYLVRSTANYADTIRISRPVKRLNSNCDDFISTPGMRHPISVTASPVKSSFAEVINYLKSPVNSWSYDKDRAVITQWRPVSMASSNPMYYEYGQIADSLFDPVPGRLFWVHSEEAVKFDFAQAIIPALYQDYTLQISSGWTHLALPVAVPVTLKQIMKATAEVWSEKMFDSLEIYRWRKTTYGYSVQSIYLPAMRMTDPEEIVLTGGIETGLAVYNRSNDAKSIVIPVSRNPLKNPAQTDNSDDMEDSRWSICLDARLKRGDSLPSAYFGYTSEGGPLAAYQPAPSFDEIKLLIKDEISGQNYSHLLVNNIDQQRMSFEVAIVNGSNVDDSVIFAIGTIKGLPQDVNLTIKDTQNGKSYAGSDSVVVGVESGKTVYLKIEAVLPVPVQSRVSSEKKYGISKLVQNRFTNDVKVEFSAPANVSKVTVSLYTLTGKAMIRESRLLNRGQSIQSVQLPLNDHSISNGSYILKLSMKDDKGAELDFKAPLLLMSR